MIYIGLDVHRDYCEVAIAEAGQVHSGGRIATSPSVLESWARKVADGATVALEATANALAIARVLEPHVGQVVLADPKAVRAAAHGGAKTDRIDAALLARLVPAASSPRSGRLMRPRALIGAWSLAGCSSCTSAPARRTRSTRCSTGG